MGSVKHVLLNSTDSEYVLRITYYVSQTRLLGHLIDRLRVVLIHILSDSSYPNRMKYSKTTKSTSCLHYFFFFCGFIWLIAVYKVFFLKRDVTQFVHHSKTPDESILAIYPESSGSHESKYIEYEGPPMKDLESNEHGLVVDQKRIPEVSEW